MVEMQFNVAWLLTNNLTRQFYSDCPTLTPKVTSGKKPITV